MTRAFPELGAAYIGANPAHRAFMKTLANTKALAYILAWKKPPPLKPLLDQAESARAASPDGTFSIGVAGRATETTVQLAIHLTGNEIDLVTEAGGFETQLYGLVYREAYRGLETYLVDLYDEIARSDHRVLYSTKKITHEDALRAMEGPGLVHAIVESRRGDLTRAGFDGLKSLYETLNLPLFAPREGSTQSEIENVASRLEAAAAIRNILEHNSAVVNNEFLKRVPDTSFEAGEQITIGLPELGDLLSAAEWTADSLNRRALAKYPITQVVAV